MPNLFMSGRVEFEVPGSESQIKDVMSDVESGWSNLDVEYEEDGITNVIEFRLSDKKTGTFEFQKTSPTSIRVTFDGVLKTSARATALAALIDNSIPWQIASISGGSRCIEAKPVPDVSELLLSKKPPKD